MSTKGQGLSLSTIVIAVLVLVVLVILVMITTGYFEKWTEKFRKISETSCGSAGGKIIAKSETCQTAYKEGSQIFEDVKDNQKCCLPKSCGEIVAGGVGTACLDKDKCGGLSVEEMTGCSGSNVCCLV